ncbi:AraC family transcriptional regulator [Enterococcus olivae]
MNQLYPINQALNYIEEHLDQEIDYQEIARIALTSEQYFKRLFSSLSGMTLSEYIRKRRLTQAAFELKKSDDKVVDIALKYGYTSPDAFSRAFQQLHGVTPTEARVLHSPLKTYPKLFFKLDIQGEEPLHYRFVQKPAFLLTGYYVEAIADLDGRSEEIIQLLESLGEPHYQRLDAVNNQLFGKGPLYFSSEYAEKGDVYVQDFYVGVPVDEIPDDLVGVAVKDTLWVVFTAIGEWEEISNTWTRIYTEWFPSSSFEPAFSPEFMINKDKETESWIAIRSK